MRRIKLLAAALSLCAVLTACDTGTAPESTAPVTPAASAESSPPQDIAPAAEVTTSAADSSAAAQSTPEPAPTTEPAESAEESAEPPTESFNEPAAESADAPAATTLTTATSATTATATTPAATTTSPAPVVIPEVRTVSSPGADVFTCDNGCIDYSNAAEGYISVTYTGGSDSAKLRMICGGQTYDHDIALGKADYFPLSCGSGSYTLQLYEHAEGKMYSLLIDKTVKLTVNSDTEMFLLPNHYAAFDKNSAAVAKSA